MENLSPIDRLLLEWCRKYYDYIDFSFNSDSDLIIYDRDFGYRIVLISNQIPHYLRIVGEILRTNNYYIDASLMGLGKTFIATAVAITLRLQLFVVCPASTRQLWEKMIRDYFKFKQNPVNQFIFSFESLISGNNIYLDKFKTIRTKSINPINSFVANQNWLNMIENGVLLLFDEFHRAKNFNQTSRASTALCQPIYEIKDCNSRIGFISATPIDKHEQALNYMRCFGYVEIRGIYDGIREKYNVLEDVINAIDQIDHNRLTRLIYRYRLNDNDRPKKELLEEFIYRIFVDICQKNFGSEIIPIEIPSDKVNFFYTIHDQNRKYRVLMLLNKLCSTLSFNEQLQSIQMPEDQKFGAVTETLRMLETEKSFIFIERARKILMTDFNQKVIIALNFTIPILTCAEALKIYDPIIIKGDVSKQDREIAISNFQEPDNECRLMIISIKVGGVGINLHDTNGNFPRTILASPNYSLMESHQVSGRVARIGTKSRPRIEFIYTMVDQKSELPILQAMILREKILEESIKKQIESGILLPGSYQTETNDSSVQPTIDKMVNKLSSSYKTWLQKYEEENEIV